MAVEYVMVNMGHATDDIVDKGLYLKEYDPEAHDGMGHVVWTTEIGEAMRFKDLTSVFSTWKRVPHSKPKRPDGKWNRPLTAYHIEVRPCPPQS
jgi:hypothetical protein